MADLNRLDAMRAIETLRSGVPSMHAVRALGCAQEQIEARFQQQLNELAGDGAPSGTLVSGGFGSGKSHTLAHLQAVALTQHFVVSCVAISKETPLFDMGKLFKSAIECAVVPGTTGRAIQELALKVDPRSDAYGALQRWASGASDFIAATLALFEHASTSPEVRERIIDFWSGDKLPIAALRAALRQAGLHQAYPSIKTPKAAELPQLRFAFAARLFRAAGFAGWALLLDEVELIGRYSLLQRAKSYAELARWFGRADQDSVHWIATVAAITDEFDFAVLDGKQDWTRAPQMLRSKGQDVLAERATRGMQLIRDDALRLRLPSTGDVMALYLRLGDIYLQAYGWPTGNVFKQVAAGSTPTRTYVRMWINAWDLMRLDPSYVPEIDADPVPPEFDEDSDLEKSQE